MPLQVRNTIGRPVRGDDFFGREEEQERLWQTLKTNDVLLLAPRRVGKTSLMRRLEERASEHGFHAVYASVEDLNDETAFVHRLLQACLESPQGPWLLQELQDGPASSWVAALKPAELQPGRFQLNDRRADLDWSALGRVLFQTLSRAPQAWLLLLDELPMLLLRLLRDPRDPDRARRFLAWFRELRSLGQNTRWVLAGSIGLDTLARTHRLSSLVNDLAREDLGPFSTPLALAFLQALSQTHELILPQDVGEAIVQRLEWPLPYFLQIVIQQARAVNPEGVPLALGDLDRLWEHMLDHQRRSYFDHWQERLEDVLTREQQQHAQLLLSQVCRGKGSSRSTMSNLLSRSLPDPDQRNQTLTFVLGVLQSDGYLMEQGGRWHFRSPLLRDWWRRHHAA